MRGTKIMWPNPGGPLMAGELLTYAARWLNA
jgi:hypothetical protein